MIIKIFQIFYIRNYLYNKKIAIIIYILSKVTCFVFIFNDKATQCTYMLKAYLNWYMFV